MKHYIEGGRDALDRHILKVSPSHASIYRATEEMYEALKQYERSGILNEWPTWLQGLRNIIAKAEGKESK